MKALDIVVTKSGNLAIISETNNEGKEASICYLNENISGKNAWWDKEELTVVNSLPRLLAQMSSHPMGRGEEDVNIFFPKENN